MTKTILTVAIPFLAPFVCYAIWVWFMTRKQEAVAEGRAPENWQNWPWPVLITTGGALAICSLVALFVFGGLGTGAEGVYVPPTVIDGEVVPGHYEPAPEPPSDD